jgi:hypothetical protein
MRDAQRTASQIGIDDSRPQCFVSAMKKSGAGWSAGVRGATHAVTSSRTGGRIDKSGAQDIINGIVPVDNAGLAKEADAPPPPIVAKSRPLAGKKKPKTKGKSIKRRKKS